MNLIPVSGPNDPGSADANASQESHGRTRRNPIPSREEILAQIVSLIGAIALRLVSTAQGSVMFRCLFALLNESNRNQKDGAGDASLADLVVLYRQNPETLDAIWPFLTNEQKDMFMKLAAKEEK